MADWSALGNMVSGMIPLYAKEGSQAYNYGQQSNAAFQEQQIQEAVRQEAKKREKAKKGKMFGSIGATLGTIGGAALAPLTGGASLLIPAALGAAGGAIGGAAGQAIGGGKASGSDLVEYGVNGAIGGYSGAKDVGFGNYGYGRHNPVGPSVRYSGAEPVGGVTAGSIAKGTMGSMLGSGGAMVQRPDGAPQMGDFGYKSMGGVMNRGGATPLKRFRLNPETGEYEYMPGGGY